jgi:hypothetical protein
MISEGMTSEGMTSEGMTSEGMTSEGMTSEWWIGKICGRKRPWPSLKYYPEICLEGLRRTTKTSVMIADLRAEIWTRDLPNTSRSVTDSTTTFVAVSYLEADS